MSDSLESVRKHSANGMPETSEFIEELSNLAVQLELLPKRRQTEAQRAISAVYSLIGGVKVNGLHCFWDNPSIYIRDVRKGLKVVGASDVLTILDESTWAQAVVQKGTDKNGYAFTSEEELRLSIIEDKLYASFVGLPTRLHLFAQKQGLYN